MHYGIITTGSRGDIQPFIALALALMKRGHRVTVVAPSSFRNFVEGFGVEFRPIPGNPEEEINSPEALRLLEGGSVFKFFYHLQKIGESKAPEVNRILLEACVDFDVLVSSVLPIAVVYSIAEKYGKKCAAVFLSMPPVPTAEFPFQALGLNGHPWVNRLSYRLAGLAYAMIRKEVDRFRAEIGLPRRNVMKALLRSDMPAITAVSEQLIRRPADWPLNASVSGFFYLPSFRRERPDGLEEWLAGGPAPVYIGFGSIPVPDRSRFFHALSGVLAVRRVVLGTGWSTLDGLPAHPNLFVTKYVDHEWLLPQCSAAVIHGGIGTVAAVLRSGIPVIVVSILADQPVNGALISKKGLGFHLPFRKLTASSLIRLLDAADDASLRARCKAVAAVIAREDGVGKAAEILDGYFAAL